MQDSQVSFPLAPFLSSARGVHQLMWPLFSAQHRTFSLSHIDKGRTQGLASN